MEYTSETWQPYGAGDAFCIDQYVPEGFTGNALDEAAKSGALELKQLTENTAVLVNRLGECVARLVSASLTNRYGLEWPEYEYR